MHFYKIVVTGGAGFVGSNLALKLKSAYPHAQVAALDSLKRRGSELALPRLRDAGVPFVHADIRCPEDLEALPAFDLLIDCSAEPSVHAGGEGSPAYVLNTNLQGTLNLLEAARTRKAAFLFLSTSRVYPMGALNQLAWHEADTRFEWDGTQPARGASAAGISEEFPLEGARSFYGASKLAGELILQEYVYNYGMPALINRCGVLAGPWQMGKVDQGVVTLWVARHHFQRPLRYIGYGGTGKQVRDLLHIEDLFALLQRQFVRTDTWDGRVYNVGGGRPVSVSLQELTALCQAATGHTVEIGAEPETHAVDLRIYLSDAARVQHDYAWTPEHDPEKIVADIAAWLQSYETQLAPLFT